MTTIDKVVQILKENNINIISHTNGLVFSIDSDEFKYTISKFDERIIIQEPNRNLFRNFIDREKDKVDYTMTCDEEVSGLMNFINNFHDIYQRAYFKYEDCYTASINLIKELNSDNKFDYYYDSFDNKHILESKNGGNIVMKALIQNGTIKKMNISAEYNNESIQNQLFDQFKKLL